MDAPFLYSMDLQIAKRFLPSAWVRSLALGSTRKQQKLALVV